MAANQNKLQWRLGNAELRRSYVARQISGIFLKIKQTYDFKIPFSSCEVECVRLLAV